MFHKYRNWDLEAVRNSEIDRALQECPALGSAFFCHEVFLKINAYLQGRL